MWNCSQKHDNTAKANDLNRENENAEERQSTSNGEGVGVDGNQGIL